MKPTRKTAKPNPLGPHLYVPLSKKLPVFITVEMHKKLMEQQRGR